MLKINKSYIARELGIDRRTVDKYINGFTKSKHRKILDSLYPTTYDSQKKTITFKTSSFSNYAIASKTVNQAPNNNMPGTIGNGNANTVPAAEVKPADSSTAPKTGDNSPIYWMIALIAMAGIGCACTMKKKHS